MNLIFGKRNVMELLQKLKKENKDAKEYPFREVLVKKNFSSDILEILKLIPEDIKITYVSLGDLDALSRGRNHQGIILLKHELKEKEKYKTFHELVENIQTKKELILVLDRIQDVGNLGNIFRTAECFGVRHIVLPERNSAPINEQVEKISSGALHYLNVYRVGNLNTSLEKLKDYGYWVAITDEEGNEDWKNLPSANELILVMGNEEKGVKTLLQKNADFKLRIPLHGKVLSLNVGVATGIALDRIVNR